MGDEAGRAVADDARQLGAESVFQQTGPELSRWVKQERDEALARHADTAATPCTRALCPWRPAAAAAASACDRC